MTAAPRYVTTADIQPAVKGQEVGVLRGLGIDWTGSRGHIDCPYPDHGGKSDWRWDDKKGLAFCTCIGKRPGEKKADTIFDVVMNRLGVDFDEAKVYVAELIRRPDLIKTKGGDKEKAANPEREIIIVSQPGWQYVAGCPDPIFVGPDGVVIAAPKGVNIELATSVCLSPDVARAGTLADWRAAVGIAASVENCEHWILGAIGGFAGTLVNLVKLPTCGIGLSGLSSLGKSSAQRLAVSAWSTPNIRRNGLFQSANITGNALEPMAQRSSGTIFALDELALLPGKIVGVLLYALAGNSGRKSNPGASPLSTIGKTRRPERSRRSSPEAKKALDNPQSARESME